MDNQKLTVCIAAILTTLLETDAPNGVVYAALQSHGVSYNEYTALILALVEGRAVKQANNVLSLTNAGRELANKINDAVSRRSNPA